MEGQGDCLYGLFIQFVYTFDFWSNDKSDGNHAVIKRKLKREM